MIRQFCDKDSETNASLFTKLWLLSLLAIICSADKDDSLKAIILESNSNSILELAVSMFPGDKQSPLLYSIEGDEYDEEAEIVTAGYAAYNARLGVSASNVS